MPVLKCPRCRETYTPVDEDFSNPRIRKDDGNHFSEQIFLRRYGHNSEGRTLECLICLMCWSINIVQPSILKMILAFLGLPVSIYKPYMKPMLYLDLHVEVNRIHDITGKDIQSIIMEDIIIPSSIFNFLLQLKLFSIGDLGMMYSGRYCDKHYSLESLISDKYTVDEMAEKYDIQDRLEEIKFNRARELV
jgi:hypothetical protein